MNDTFKFYASVIAIVLVASAIGGYVAGLVGGNQPNFSIGGSSDSGYNATGDGVYAVDGTTIIDATGQWVGTIIAAARATFDAGTLRSYTNATSTTATAYTAVQADILNYDTIVMTPNVGALTITLPATSTLTSLVPSVGDRQDQCWYNATSTAAATITFVAGTGMDLERTATSTSTGSAGVLGIRGQNSACLTYIREADTDITVLMHNFIDAD